MVGQQPNGSQRLGSSAGSPVAGGQAGVLLGGVTLVGPWSALVGYLASLSVIGRCQWPIRQPAAGVGVAKPVCVSTPGRGRVTAMDLRAALDAYAPRPGREAADVDRVRALAARADPWARHAPVHVTGSAFVVDPPSRRVLLRWHERMGSWLHVGGHVDPGESSPLVAARREAREETGLTDLAPWPDPDRPRILHVAVVPVPAGRGEPAHEHADVRYVLSTGRPDEIVPESPAARLRWLPIDEAISVVSEDNVSEALQRLGALLDGTGDDRPSTSTSA